MSESKRPSLRMMGFPTLLIAASLSGMPACSPIIIPYQNGLESDHALATSAPPGGPSSSISRSDSARDQAARARVDADRPGVLDSGDDDAAGPSGGHWAPSGQWIPAGASDAEAEHPREDEAPGAEPADRRAEAERDEVDAPRKQALAREDASTPTPSPKERVIDDAMVHVIMGLDAYVAGDFPSAAQDLNTALDTLLAADLPRGRRGLKLLQKNLPAGYAHYDLRTIYKEASKRAAEEEVSAPIAEVVSSEDALGGPQGMGADPAEAIASAQNADDAANKSESPPDIDHVAAIDGGGRVSRNPLPIEPAVIEHSKPPEGNQWLNTDDMAFVRSEIDRILLAFGESEYPHSSLFEEQVAYFIHQYQTDLHRFFERSLIRAAKYMPMVQRILDEKNVPDAMAYIALVESGFRPDARSRAGAAGLWQFMPRTARAYGLRVDRRIDERLDPERSTLAAREYFLDLVAIFGSRSFLLAMASYNAGEGRIQYCLKQLDDPFTQRSFWHIRGCVRRETREYIPRIIAAATVARAPKRFGFGYVEPFSDPTKYQVVTVSSPTSLALLATLTHLQVDELKAINLDLGEKALTTPRHMSTYRLLVPADRKAAVESELRLIAERKAAEKASEARIARADGRSKKAKASGKGGAAAGKRAKAKGSGREAKGSASRKGHRGDKHPPTRYIRYEVKKGNTLTQIAEDFHTSVAKLKEWNPYLKKRGLQVGDRVHIYELDWSYEKHVHKVARGDTLGKISARYGVPIDRIRRWNGIKGNTIQRGRSLVLYTHDGDGHSARVAHKAKPRSKPIVYTVRRGDNLSLIAAAFDVHHRDIMRWNGLKNARIRPGQKLTIYPGKGLKAEKYRVRSGDTLGRVARRFKTRAEYIMVFNGMTSDRLLAGQQLTIYRK